MKDTTYFNDKIFLFTNRSLKQKLAEQARKQSLPQYFVVDTALREYLERNGMTIRESPKRNILA